MKEIVNVRIDDRLIHGQVAAYWTHALDVTRIMVANDAASNDEIARATLKMATPQGVALSVLSVDKAAENILSGRYAQQKVLLILKNPLDALKLYGKGVRFETLNVANLSGGGDRRPITGSLCCNREEVDALVKLHSSGVEIQCQLVPEKSPIDLMEYLDRAAEGRSE